MVFKSIGLVGRGAITKAILRADLPVPIAGLTSRTEETARSFLDGVKGAPPYLSRADLIDQSDLLIEAAGGHAVPDVARDVFAAGKGLMVISVGALLEHPWIVDEARTKHLPLFIPSGAIAGLDAVK